MADILLCLADRIFKKTEFDLPLSRKELAELTGLSSETVIRVLKKFDGERLEVVDYERLRQISERG